MTWISRDAVGCARGDEDFMLAWCAKRERMMMTRPPSVTKCKVEKRVHVCIVGARAGGNFFMSGLERFFFFFSVARGVDMCE